jgi:hypothetical protein
MSCELTPRPPDPPDEKRVTKVLLSIGRRRWEHTFISEVREITAGPAEVIAIRREKSDTDKDAQ